MKCNNRTLKDKLQYKKKKRINSNINYSPCVTKDISIYTYRLNEINKRNTIRITQVYLDEIN